MIERGMKGRFKKLKVKRGRLREEAERGGCLPIHWAILEKTKLE